MRTQVIAIPDQIEYAKYHINAGHLFAKVKVSFGNNHSDSLWSILDTGAPTVISDSIGNKYKSTSKKIKQRETKLKNAGHTSEQFGLAKAFTFSINKNVFYKKFTLTKSQKYLSQLGDECFMPKECHLILGSDIFREGLFILNTKDKKYAIASKSKLKDVINTNYWSSALSFRAVQDYPHCNFRVFSIECKQSGLDIGNAGGITILFNPKNLNRVNEIIQNNNLPHVKYFTNHVIANVDGNSITGGSIINYFTAIFDSVEIGGHVIKDKILIEFIEHPNLKEDYQINIGYDFLKNFNLVFNYPLSTVYFDQHQNIQDTLVNRPFGLDVNTNTIRMINTSTGNTNNLSIGDKLISVNDVLLEKLFLNVDRCEMDSIRKAVYKTGNRFLFLKEDGKTTSYVYP